MMGTTDADERDLLRQSIERQEAELRDAVDDLTHAVKRELTLTARVAENPRPWLVGAFLLGVWLGRSNA